MSSNINLESNSTKQEDEIEALSSIYGTDFHIENPKNKSYYIEINEASKATLEVSFPPEYPTEAPPIYSICAPWLKGPKRQELSRHLEEIYLDNIGESIVYLWVEKIRQFIIDEAIQSEQHGSFAEEETECEVLEASISELNVNDDASNVEPEKCPEIFSGGIITDRKSYFQPHLAAVTSVAEVKTVLKKLYENKKIANATHNMFAYRFRQKNTSVMVQDCDDDGETHAGGRMLHLLQILNSENVVVIVSRWYGGIQLGADRFKHINNAARNILLSCGYIKAKEEKTKKGKKK